jgi:hypothetical protein
MPLPTPNVIDREADKDLKYTTPRFGSAAICPSKSDKSTAPT